MSSGRYLEDFKVGDVYPHRPGRTLSEADNTWFSLLTMNQHPLHCDAHYASQSEFGRLVVNSGLTIAIVMGLSVADTSYKAIANLGIDKLRLTAPGFIGDTIYAESEVLSVRESDSREGQGVVVIRTRGKRADGEVFMTYERTMLIPKRGYGVGEAEPA